MATGTVADESAVPAPIAPGLFTWPAAEPRLIASRRDADAPLEFPAIPGDQEVLLARTGTLYTWTTQEFPPPSPPYRGPAEFEPYAVGYVEFPEGILIEGRIATPDPKSLTIGQAMTVVVTPFRTDPDGTNVVTFAFAPTSNPAQSEESE
ncbi:Zn-ribbon domain-containing OB-fold protein [Nocardia sp. alder85J]|uniref:Zn-ribbon domain-containing OB-fold protein n=1 Tax=Nocardia sp. alder85J TaxID=2862949 RepID=UPI001CD4127C|nr:OB-fold domain-containing protein [Nocardia sp. alder85J]MCX4095738.1 OB-fold domain-containing protein [Nocardia sp. alder85J]